MSAEPRIPAPTIRVMRADDLQRIAQIEQDAYPFPWSEGIFRDCLRVGYCCVVLEGEDGVQGYGIMSVAADEAHLLNICIRPDLQRCGLGSDLLDWLLDKAREGGAERILLEVRPTNRAALALYKKNGFEAVGLRRGYYRSDQRREDAVVLALPLTPP